MNANLFSCGDVIQISNGNLYTITGEPHYAEPCEDYVYDMVRYGYEREFEEQTYKSRSLGGMDTEKSLIEHGAKKVVVAWLINDGGFLDDNYLCSNCMKAIWSELSERCGDRRPEICKHCGAVIVDYKRVIRYPDKNGEV